MEEQSKESLLENQQPDNAAGSGRGWTSSPKLDQAEADHLIKRDLKQREEGWEIVTTGAVVAEALWDSGNQACSLKLPTGSRVHLSLPPPACF